MLVAALDGESAIVSTLLEVGADKDATLNVSTRPEGRGGRGVGRVHWALVLWSDQQVGASVSQRERRFDVLCRRHGGEVGGEGPAGS